MTRSELAASISQSHPHLTLADVKRAVDTIFDKIANALTEGHRVELRDFGVFQVKFRRAHVGRNPRSGETVSVGDKRRPHFKAGNALRRRVNDGA